MTPNSQDIMTAVMKLQEDLTKLYKTGSMKGISAETQAVSCRPSRKVLIVFNKTDPVPTPNEAETPLPVDPVMIKKKMLQQHLLIFQPMIYKAASAAGHPGKRTL